MSTDINPETTIKADDPNPELRYHNDIRREREPEFAAIVRNRSGMDAGRIDFGLRPLDILAEGDKRDITETAYSLYLAICNETGMRSSRE